MRENGVGVKSGVEAGRFDAFLNFRLTKRNSIWHKQGGCIPVAMSGETQEL
jgi:hypothetical protein